MRLFIIKIVATLFITSLIHCIAVANEKADANNDDYDFDEMFKEGTNQKSADLHVESPNISGDYLEKAKEESEKALQRYYDRYQKKRELSPQQIGEGYCFGIGSEDMRNSCLAQVNYQESNCFGISNENRRNMCIAIVRSEHSYCFSISSENMRASCIAQIKNDKSYCFNISYEPMRLACLGQTTHEQHYCYGIKNEDMRLSCLANSL